MSVNVPREVIVDDDATGVLYNGSWQLSHSQNLRSTGFNPFSNTIHGTTGNAGFSYSFTGSDGRILGMITNDSSNSSSSFEDVGVESLPWQCFLDGALIPTPLPPDAEDHTDFSWPLCEWSGISVDNHTVSIHVDQLVDGQTLWVDEVMFVPDSNSVINNSIVFVDHSDPAIRYGDGWSFQNGSHVALGGGTNLTFPFVGTALSWFAIIPEDVPQNTSSALFSIDGQTPATVPIVGDTKHKDSSQNQFSRLIFQSPALLFGQHTLTVVSEGDPNLVPLILSYFVLENSELPATQTLPSGSAITSIPTRTSFLPPDATSSNNIGFGDDVNSGSGGFQPLNIGIIIGSMVGGVAFLLLVLFGVLLFRRRQSRKRKQRALSLSAESGYLPSSLDAKLRITMQQATQQDYPFSQNSTPQLESNNGYNFEKRFTHGSSKSTGERPNSLFPVSRLSVLPTKGEATSPDSSPRTYIPRPLRFSGFSLNSRFTSASSVTLLPHHSSSAAAKRSSRPFSDDERTVMGSRDSHSSTLKLPRGGPPDPNDPPPYSTG